jgi:hypothetical protein
MRTHSWLVLAFLTAGATHAWADVPPPSDYVEQCTLAKKQTTTSECLECRAWMSHINRCANTLSSYCYTKVCQSYGASAWTEVLCRAKDPGAPVVPSATLSVLVAPSADEPYSADGGVDGVPGTCASYTSPPAPTSDGGSGCSVSTEGRALRALGPLALAFAMLALVAFRRRSRR